jgi:hypothetical protein
VSPLTSQAAAEFAQQGKPFPKSIVIFASTSGVQSLFEFASYCCALSKGDNTVRELKNQYCMDYVAQLVSRRKIRLAGLFFLRKSHTHDVIGALANFQCCT